MCFFFFFLFLHSFPRFAEKQIHLCLFLGLPKCRPLEEMLLKDHHLLSLNHMSLGFPSDSVVKNPPANPGDFGFDSWVGKIPWIRKRQPPPVFFLGNPMDRGAWRATVHRVTKSWTRLSNQRTIITPPQDPGCCSQAALHRLATLSQVSPALLCGCLL